VPAGTDRPALWVFNHSAWSTEVASLVSEVLELERRFGSYPVEGPRTEHHFDLHNLTYATRVETQELRNGNGHVQLFTRGYVEFESQADELERTTTFADAIGGREHVVRTRVRYPAYTVLDAVGRLRGRLRSVDDDLGTDYARQYSRAALTEIIERSLERIGETRGLVSEQNLQLALRAMGNVRRPAARTARIYRDPDQLRAVSTRDMRGRSIGIGGLERDATVFWDSRSGELSQDRDAGLLEDITREDSPLPRRASYRVENAFLFKTPVNAVIASHEPERSFLRRLFDPDVAERVHSWVKSPDAGFYEIEYTWRRGDHTKLGRFNPDVFILLENVADVLVIELKDDDDVSDENRAKQRAALEHFNLVNEAQGDRVYHFKFLSPNSYDAFFEAVRNGTVTNYRSRLDAQLAG
jgi:type III restriction enzyme